MMARVRPILAVSEINKHMKCTNILITGAVVVLIACSREEPPPAVTPPPSVTPSPAQPAPLVLPTERLVPVESMMRGARLYQEHCAQCHGPEAQGHPDWENTQVVAAPPLNGTGKEWKLKKLQLFGVIENGSTKDGMPVMPGFKGRLSDEEIEDIISWFQALWPAEVYEIWRKANATPAKPAG